MTVCAVIDCKKTGTHLFPKDAKRRKLWEKALRRKNWKSSSANLHKMLKITAIPSIFSFTKIKLPSLRAQQRSERLRNRNKKKALCFEIKTPEIPDPVNHDVLVTDIQVPLGKEIVLPSTSSAPLISALPVNVSDRPKTDKSSQVNFEYIYGCIEKYKKNDVFIAFFTGFESYQKFYYAFSTLSPMAHLIKYYRSRVEHISVENQFFMTMMKLRRNTCYFELAQFFNTSLITVSNIFITWINFMYQLWSQLNIWPSNDLVEYYMPDSFKTSFKNAQVIIDGTEMKMEKPGNPISQQASWSSYKHNNRTLARQRVHIESLIGLTKTYKILKEDLHHTYAPLASRIFFVCLMCCNFRKSIK